SSFVARLCFAGAVPSELDQSSADQGCGCISRDRWKAKNRGKLKLVKQIAYAGHDTKLLSAEVMRDLNVWDRGVTTTQDLNKLRLDPNKPGSFREILQPYLLKQYQN
ncbi:hypothetical protein LGM69_30580, partial [Burkholderia multivorans]|nr:hypothetical protein [Burkholderia multivorans]